MAKKGAYKISGIPMQGMEMTTGNIFFVDSSTGSDSNEGVTLTSPFATIDYAIGECAANKGDIIYAMPGHTETLTAAADIAMDVAGVSIIGLGLFDSRPTLTFSTAATADINVSAANCRISNIKMVSGINDLANFIDVDEGQFQVDKCTFVTSSTYEALCFINIATTYDDYKILDCEFLQPSDPEGTGAAAGTGAIYCVDSENILIENCRFRGYFETGIVHNKTTKVQNLIVRNCELSNGLTVPFVLVADSTGICTGCYGETLIASDATEAQVYGTIGTRFWIDVNTSLGNDSGGGGQGGVTGTVAS